MFYVITERFLTFSNLDWEKSKLIIVQQKTKKKLEYPLSASIGNAIVDYLLYERPESSSQYIFLCSLAPHYPLISHSAIRGILKKLFNAANVIRTENMGTRFTRHNRATFLLRKGVPLDMIAESLGHNGLNTVIRYLSADEKEMVDCILPLPI